MEFDTKGDFMDLAEDYDIMSPKSNDVLRRRSTSMNHDTGSSTKGSNRKPQPLSVTGNGELAFSRKLLTKAQQDANVRLQYTSVNSQYSQFQNSDCSEFNKRQKNKVGGHS